jgi:protein-disulfide isomerase
MTQEPERHDVPEVEEALRQFRPVGPPADLRARALSAEPQPTPARRLTWRRVVFVGGALAAAAIVGLQLRTEPTPEQRFAGARASGSPASGLTSGERATFQAAWVKESRVDLGIPADGASVLVVEFSDVLCPQCEGIRRASREVLPNYVKTGRVKYVVADWPADTSCNKRMSIATTPRPGACAAAAFVRVARNRGQAEAMEDWLFANRDRIANAGATAEAVVHIGAADVLGAVDFDGEYRKELSAIREEIAADRTFTPASTPMVFVNGARLLSGVKPEYLDYAIQLELRSGRGPAMRAQEGGNGEFERVEGGRRGFRGGGYGGRRSGDGFGGAGERGAEPRPELFGNPGPRRGGGRTGGGS